MSNALINQQVNANASEHRQRSIMNVILWIIQVLLAFNFLMSGSMKLILPIEQWNTMLVVPLPGLFIRFIGVVEVAGALGLILPRLTRILPFLTFWAACGLVLEMIVASIITVIALGFTPALLLPVIPGLLAAFIVYQRRPGSRWA